MDVQYDMAPAPATTAEAAAPRRACPLSFILSPVESATAESVDQRLHVPHSGLCSGKLPVGEGANYRGVV